MFPLSELSMLFLALLVIAFWGLGFMVLMGMLICKIFERSNPQISSPTTPPPNPQLVPQTQTQPDITEKIDNIKNEIVLGTNIAIYALAFAFVVYAVQALLNNQNLQGLFGLVFSLIMLQLGNPKVRQSLGERIGPFRRLLNIGSSVGSWVLVIITLYIAIRLIFRI